MYKDLMDSYQRENKTGTDKHYDKYGTQLM